MKRSAAQMLCGPVRRAQPQKHYGCFMLSCRIPLKRLMAGSLSQPRRAIVHAARSDLLNEFISLAQTKSALSTWAPPSLESTLEAERDKCSAVLRLASHLCSTRFFKGGH